MSFLLYWQNQWSKSHDRGGCAGNQRTYFCFFSDVMPAVSARAGEPAREFLAPVEHQEQSRQGQMLLHAEQDDQPV
jgi:hypothetical protein